MWSRSELKSRAKEVLKVNYWRAVLVSLILMFIGGSAGSGASGASSSSNRSSLSSLKDALSSFDPSVIAAAVSIFIAIFLIIFLISLALQILVFNPLIVGCQRFFVKCRSEQPTVGEVAFAFKASYKNVIKTIFLMDLFTALWTLLFIIPGIVKSYEYRMIPYILAENPELNYKEAFARSKAMMNGEKWHAFVLDLSFIGWELLGALTCCILNVFYVNPYYYLTCSELYATLKQKVEPPTEDIA